MVEPSERLYAINMKAPRIAFFSGRDPKFMNKVNRIDEEGAGKTWALGPVDKVFKDQKKWRLLAQMEKRDGEKVGLYCLPK